MPRRNLTAASSSDAPSPKKAQQPGPSTAKGEAASPPPPETPPETPPPPPPQYEPPRLDAPQMSYLPQIADCEDIPLTKEGILQELQSVTKLVLQHSQSAEHASPRSWWKDSLPASAINADGAVPGILTPLFSGYWWGIRRILEDAGFDETEANWREGPFLDPHADAAQWLGELLDALAEMPLILMVPPHFDAWTSLREHVLLEIST